MFEGISACASAAVEVCGSLSVERAGWSPTILRTFKPLEAFLYDG